MNEGARQKTKRIRPKTRTRGSAFGLGVAAALALFLAALPGRAQTTPSFAAPAAYNMQPGTVPIGVVTGVFNNSAAACWILRFSNKFQIAVRIRWKSSTERVTEPSARTAAMRIQIRM